MRARFCLCGMVIKLSLSFLLSYDFFVYFHVLLSVFFFVCFFAQCFNLLFIGRLLSSIAVNRSHFKPEGILNSFKLFYPVEALSLGMKIIDRKRVQRNKVCRKGRLTAEGELMLCI